MKTISGEVAGVYLTAGPSSFLTEEVSELAADFGGIVNDRHYGTTMPSDGRMTYIYPRKTEIRNSRQVSWVSVEDLKAVAAAMGAQEIRPEWLGANILIAGIPNLTLLPPSARLHFHRPGKLKLDGMAADKEAVLMVRSENLPCIGPGDRIGEALGKPALASKFPKAALHLRGGVGWVEKPGLICKGDGVKLVISMELGFNLAREQYRLA